MDIYVISPVNHLSLMNEGNRFFCLAQLYKKHEKYRTFFKQKVKDGYWVTLDNGAGDHDIVTMKDLIHIMVDLHPSEVIPPDVLFDGISTLRNFEDFIRNDSRSCMAGKKIEIFACPQGRTEADWMFLYRYFLHHPEVNTIGFSKIAVPFAFFNVSGDVQIKEARNYAYQTLKAKGLIQKPIHLLGMGDPREMEMYLKDPLMRSTDSCNTVWAGMNGICFEDGNFERIPTPKDYFDRSISVFDMNLVYKNVKWFRTLVNS